MVPDKRWKEIKKGLYVKVRKSGKPSKPQEFDEVLKDLKEQSIVWSFILGGKVGSKHELAHSE
ncbi:hypothetical protein SY88_10180 [Clostridiales bacterium PH28_bin88]|nr:hypothetical protein SY88_10180 [Clostridiales bacterium PH28_bin88]